MSAKLSSLNKEIIACTKCPELRSYCEQVAKDKVRRFSKHDYWGKPVPSFGDPNAKVLIVGLAPAAHGANRTGRMFTGDSSGDWLFKALYNADFTNQPVSVFADDGLELNDVYVSTIVHCAPPLNKPSKLVIENCLSYLKREIEIMANLRLIICLGQLSFNNICKIYQLKKQSFGHNQRIMVRDDLQILCSYHPSRQNTQTGRLKWAEWERVFLNAKKLTGY